MTINFTEFFTRAGRAFEVGRLFDLYGVKVTGTIPAAIEGAHDELMSTPTTPEMVVIGENLPGDIDVFIGAATSGTSASLSYVRDLLVQTVQEDTLRSHTVSTALDELIRQMALAGPAQTLDRTVFAAPSVAALGGNTGTGTLLISTKDKSGNTLAFMHPEVIRFTSLASPNTFSIRGQTTVRSASDPNFETSGSGNTGTTSSIQNGGLLPNAGFETEDANIVNAPASIFFNPAEAGVDVFLTPVEVQTITVSGGGTGEFFRLGYTPGTILYETGNLPWNASAPAVQSALQALPKLSTVTVTRTGIDGSQVYTVTFTGVTNPKLISAVPFLGVGGNVVPANVTQASANANSGARCLQATVADFGLWIPVTLSPRTVYAVGCFLAMPTPGTGNIEMGIYDGDGPLAVAIDNDAYPTPAANSITKLASTVGTTMGLFSTFVQTPEVLPDSIYFGIKADTLTQDLFLDDMFLLRPKQLYGGGPHVLLVHGGVDWETGDIINVTIPTPSPKGLMHMWMNRTFNLMGANKVMATDTAPGTQPDSLIT